MSAISSASAWISEVTLALSGAACGAAAGGTGQSECFRRAASGMRLHEPDTGIVASSYDGGLCVLVGSSGNVYVSHLTYAAPCPPYMSASTHGNC